MHVFCPESIHDRNLSALSGVKNCVSVSTSGDASNDRRLQDVVDSGSQANERPLTGPSVMSLFIPPCKHAPHLVAVPPRETFGQPAWRGENQRQDRGRGLTKKQLVEACRAIGDGIMAVVNGVVGILTGVVNAGVGLCRLVVRCLTCGKVGR